MLLQAALLGAGSLDPRLVKGLRARATLARRYLALEGRRVLAELAVRIPLDAALLDGGQPSTSTADESLEVAKSRTVIADPPAWFGAIKPSQLMAAPPPGPGGKATDKDLQLQFDPIDMPESDEDDEDDDDDGGKSGGQQKSSSCSRVPSSTTSRCRTTCARCSGVHVPPRERAPRARR